MQHVDCVVPQEPALPTSPQLHIELQDAPHSQATPDECAGRRIVDLQYFFTQLQIIAQHDRVVGCDFLCLEIVSEMRNGLESTIVIKCKMCGKFFDVRTVESKDDRMNVNHQAVSSIMSIGSGFSHLQMITSNLHIPGISPFQYQSLHTDVCDWWERSAEHCMAESAKQEADYAVSVGDIDADGTPMIAVVADGCWSKRSYKTNYSALSGVAAIIGLRFGKVLYLGVKNKYCMVCARAANKNGEPPQHTCFKNHSGSSTAMESAILVEGFKNSVRDSGLIYNKLIADGDSSTYKSILDARPYKHLVVQKIECINHLLRNYSNALMALSQDKGYPMQLRKLVKDRIMRFRTGVKKACEYWGCQNLGTDLKVELLKKDILNGPQHIFGNHSNCSDYFCKPETRRAEPGNPIPSLVACGLMKSLEDLVRKLSYHSLSLLYNISSNLVESYNSQVAKYVGGKRVNYSLRRSYGARCAAGVVSFNTGRLHSVTHNIIFHTDANSLVSKVENDRQKWVRTSKPKKKTKIPVPVPKDSHYGPSAERPDMAPNVYEEEKKRFLDDLKMNNEQRTELQLATVSQRASNLWFDYRRKLLTSSWFGEVCVRRDSTSCASLVKRILQPKNAICNLPAVRYGLENEERAKQKLSEQERVVIKDCGLFLDDEFEYLGTSPDGLYAGGIVEVKCPDSLKGMGFGIDAMTKHSFWKRLTRCRRKDQTDRPLQENDFEINTGHKWYFQMQGQLHITKTTTCLFGIWFGDDNPMKVYYVERDDQFWETKMKSQLQIFYLSCLLPELIDSRQERGMNIRDPEYILKAIEKLKKEKSDRTKTSNLGTDR